MSAALPNLIIPGAQKSGTTFLAALLAQHPDIFVPEVKEPAHYLAALHQPVLRRNGVARDYAYADRAAYHSLYDEAGAARWRIDASTGYLIFDDIARAIAQDSPGARAICVLRQPSDRAWSAYVYHRQLGQDDSDTFDAALANEADLAARGTISQPLVDTGFYARHVENWQNALGAENVLVVLFEDLRGKLQDELDRITDWLGVARFVPDTDSERNASHRPLTGWRGRVMGSIFGGGMRGPRSFLKQILPPSVRQAIRSGVRKGLRPSPGDARPDAIPADLRDRLNARYDADFADLEKMIDRDLSHWRKRV